MEHYIPTLQFIFQNKILVDVVIEYIEENELDRESDYHYVDLEIDGVMYENILADDDVYEYLTAINEEAGTIPKPPLSHFLPNNINAILN